MTADLCGAVHPGVVWPCVCTRAAGHDGMHACSIEHRSWSNEAAS